MVSPWPPVSHRAPTALRQPHPPGLPRAPSALRNTTQRRPPARGADDDPAIRCRGIGTPRACGILGRVCGLLALVGHAAGTITPALVDAVAGASHLMRHRGPDEPGTWTDAVGAAGRRHQAPSCWASTGSRSSISRTPTSRCAGARRTSPDRYVLVFNGEIYNYLELRAELRRTPRCACSPPTATARRSSPPTTTGAPTPWAGCAACSPSRCGTPAAASCSAPATRSGSSRCSWRPARAARRWAARRSACWNSPTSWASTPPSTPARSSTTPCCSTCPSRRRCTAACAAWSPAATR